MRRYDELLGDEAIVDKTHLSWRELHFGGVNDEYPVGLAFSHAMHYVFWPRPAIHNLPAWCRRALQQR
jgi:hypothetical protein